MKINDLNSELELMKESDIRSEEREVSVTKKPIPEKTEILERRGFHLNLQGVIDVFFQTHLMICPTIQKFIQGFV